MILQALKEYYDRKAADPINDMAPEGFEKKEIPFIVVIKPNGDFVNLKFTREKHDAKIIFKRFMVPRSKIRTGAKSYETTFLLWDHIGYLFGYPDSDSKAAKQHQTWINFLNSLPENLKVDEGVKAILLFYEKGQIASVKSHPSWGECIKIPSCNMTFSLVDDDEPIPCRPAVQAYVRDSLLQSAKIENEDAITIKSFSHCLITGEYGEIARTHGRTPINKDTKSFVAFQKNSGYDSFGKAQGYNAPVCKKAEFAYTTGLNTLLKSIQQRIKVGDATTVFWSERASPLETEAFLFFSELPKDDPDRNTEAIKAIYESIWNGTFIVPDDHTRFYVLGLSPNSARIAVRFWQVGTVGEMGTRFKQYVDDLFITHGVKAEHALPMKRLLRSIAAQGKDDNIPPNLAGEMMRTIIDGSPFPVTLLQAAIRRNRAEQDVLYPRAALIKACLNRSLRFNNPNNEKEITMCLDLGNTNIGYRLGRLFAALEKIQSDANPGINATIRDRFYGAASSTPVTVFGNLLRLSNHHLSKLEKDKRGLYFIRRQLIGDIMCNIKEFPTHLSLADQGRFAIGYYHQMQDLWTKKTTNP
jgi:CRISPR-associated protein Csd1